jgi:probable rRNA maturation factor
MRPNINILIRKFELKVWFEKAIEKFEKIENLKSEQISIVIVGDRRIKTLNKKYRRKDEVTDVLSFVQNDIDKKYRLEKNNYLGEIFINFRQAERQSKNVKEEILNLLVHGYLHLKGYTHNNDKDMLRIKKLTEKIVLKIMK